MMVKFAITHIIISFLIILLIVLIISFLTLWERKLLAGIQRRQGPVFVGSFGLLQPFADGLKLLTKPINFSTGVYYYIFLLSSIFSLTLSLLPWSIIPFNSNFVYADINLGILFILAISSLNVYTILFSGWASNSKYGLLGSIRSGAQMISYEIPMSLSILPIILFTSSANLTEIVNFQINHFWFIIFVPFSLIFFITALAEANRTPFDLPEAESELVAGYNMEYSSLSFAVFFLAEYNHILVMSFLFSILFLGGWSFIDFSIIYNFCFSILNIIGSLFFNHDDLFFEQLLIYYELIKEKSFLFIVSLFDFQKFNLFIEFLALKNDLKLIIESFILFFKAFIIASLFIIIRAILPRYKFVQLIIACWEIFIPVLLFLFYLIIFIFISFFLYFQDIATPIEIIEPKTIKVLIREAIEYMTNNSKIFIDNDEYFYLPGETCSGKMIPSNPNIVYNPNIYNPDFTSTSNTNTTTTNTTTTNTTTSNITYTFSGLYNPNVYDPDAEIPSYVDNLSFDLVNKIIEYDIIADCKRDAQKLIDNPLSAFDPIEKKSYSDKLTEEEFLTLVDHKLI
jgi:NADH:ubiquinone oxidoreductase subunit H